MAIIHAVVYQRTELGTGWKMETDGIGNITGDRLATCSTIIRPMERKRKREKRKKKRKKTEGSRSDILLRNWKLGVTLPVRIKMKFTVTNVGRIGISRVIHRFRRAAGPRSPFSIARKRRYRFRYTGRIPRNGQVYLNVRRRRDFSVDPTARMLT